MNLVFGIITTILVMVMVTSLLTSTNSNREVDDRKLDLMISAVAFLMLMAMFYLKIFYFSI